MEKSVSNVEKCISNAEKSISNAEKSISNVEKRISNAEKSVSNVEKPISNAEMSISNTRKPFHQAAPDFMCCKLTTILLCISKYSCVTYKLNIRRVSNENNIHCRFTIIHLNKYDYDLSGNSPNLRIMSVDSIIFITED